MNNYLQLFVYLAIVLFLFTASEAKGGRSSGRRGKSSGRSSIGRRGSTSSISSSGSSSYGGNYQTTHGWRGGWFHGFFHISPSPYSYRPTYISSNHYPTNPSVSSYQTQTVDTEVLDQDAQYATGFSISRALNGDFFSIFNVVNDISKYPEKIKNKLFLTTTTTEAPVTTTTTIKPTYTKVNPTINYQIFDEDYFYKWLDYLHSLDEKEADKKKKDSQQFKLLV